MLNNNGPNLEPWGTPTIMYSWVLKLLFPRALCYLLVKYLSKFQACTSDNAVYYGFL